MVTSETTRQWDYYVSPIPGDIGDGLILGFLGCISLCHYMGTWWYRILVIFMGIWVISCYIYIILINYIPLGIVWTWVTYMFFANHEGKITWNITSNHGIILRMVAKSRTTSDGWKLRQSTNWCRISQPFTVWFAAFVLKKAQLDIIKVTQGFLLNLLDKPWSMEFRQVWRY